MSIVLIDRPLDKSVRRLIGEIFHTQTSGQNPFLLIDQVLFLYLAMHQVISSSYCFADFTFIREIEPDSTRMHSIAILMTFSSK